MKKAFVETKVISNDTFNRKNNILVSYLGERNTGGYSIEVESLYWKEKVLYVKTREIKPGKGEMVTMAITKPYCISLIPKTKKIVYK